MNTTQAEWTGQATGGAALPFTPNQQVEVRYPDGSREGGVVTGSNHLYLFVKTGTRPCLSVLPGFVTDKTKEAQG